MREGYLTDADVVAGLALLRGTGMACGFQGRTAVFEVSPYSVMDRKSLSQGIPEWAHRNRSLCKQLWLLKKQPTQ